MNKLFLATAAFATLGLAATASAQDGWAQDAPGTIGVGVDHTLTGLTGGSVRYLMNEMVGFELMFGMDSSSQVVEDASLKTSQMDISFLADIRFTRAERAVLSAYGGLGLSMLKATGDTWAVTEAVGVIPAVMFDDTVSHTDMAFEVGLRGEVWLYDFFSLYGRFGVNYNPRSGSDLNYESMNPDADDNTDVSGGELAVFRGDALGMFGFTFWMD